MTLQCETICITLQEYTKVALTKKNYGNMYSLKCIYELGVHSRKLFLYMHEEYSMHTLFNSIYLPSLPK